MDGLQLCRKIRRSDPVQPYTYVILLTGQNGKAQLAEGMAAGADEYITKPLDLDQLKGHLDAARRVITVHEQVQLPDRSYGVRARKRSPIVFISVT